MPDPTPFKMAINPRPSADSSIRRLRMAYISQFPLLRYAPMCVRMHRCNPTSRHRSPAVSPWAAVTAQRECAHLEPRADMQPTYF